MSSSPPNRKNGFPSYAVTALVIVGYALVNYICLGKLQLCMWRAMCGYPCPGCGLTHAGLFLLSGNIKESIVWHPFLIPICLTILISFIPYGKWHFVDRFRQQRWWMALLLVIVFGYFIWRLIVYYPQPMDEGPMYFDEHNYHTRISNMSEDVLNKK